MHIVAIKTHRIQVGESITEILDAYLPPLEEGCIVAITSKILSLCQGRVVSGEMDKATLIKQEADGFLESPSKYNICLTIKGGRLVPSAGIDESNGKGVYILYPQEVQKTAAFLWDHLRTKFQLQNLGILITDSSTTPLRRGVNGIALGWCGFEALHNYIGTPDIFGKPLRVTLINNLDSLAASAVFAMGEGAEQTPLALIQNAPRIRFIPRPPTREEEENVQIPLEDDLYAPLLQSVKWVWNKK